MEFPVDGLASVSQEVMERSAQEYMNSILYSNPDSPEYLTLGNNTQVPISLSHVGFTPLYGVSSRQKVLAIFSPQDQLKAVGLYLLDRWWSLEDILKTADPNRDGCLEVKTLGERIVLYILNRCVYRANEIDSDEIPFLCHAESDKAKILWQGGQAAGFYSVKPSGSLCSSYITQCYQLPVMDSIFVRKCHRGNGLGLQMLEDFVDSFKEEDCLGLKGSLSKAMYKVCEKFLRLCPADRDLLWEVESVGGPSQRTNIADKIQTMNMCVLSKNLSFTEHSMENLEVSENEVVMDEVTLHISEQEAMEYTVEIVEEVTLVKDTKETEETPVTTQNRSSSHKQKEISENRQLEKVIRVEDIEAEAETPKAEETEAVTVAESNKEELAIDVVETTTENEPGLEIGEHCTTETMMCQTSTVLLVDLEKTHLQQISPVEIENVASEIEEVEKAQEAPNEVSGSYHEAKEKETEDAPKEIQKGRCRPRATPLTKHEVQEDKVREEQPTVKQSVEGHEKLLAPEKEEAPVVDTRFLRRGRKSIPATLTGKCNFTKKGKRPSEEEEKEEAPDAKTTAQRIGKKCVPAIPTTKCKSKRYAKGKHPQEEKVEKPEEKAAEPQKPVAEAKVLRRGKCLSAATATPRHKIPQTHKDPENEENVAEPVSEVEEEEKYVVEEEIEQEEAEVKNRSLEKSVAEVKVEKVKVEDRKTEDTEREAKKQMEIEEETVVKIAVEKQNKVVEGTEKVEEDKEATVVGIVTDEVPVEEHTLALKKATVGVEELKKPTIRSAMEIKNVDKKIDELTTGELVDKVPEKPIEEEEKMATTASRKDAKAESLKEIVKVPPVVETRASASRSRTKTITPKQKSMQIEPSVDNNEQNTVNAHIDLVKEPDAATVESLEKVVRAATTKKEKMMERVNPTDKEQVEKLTTEEEKNVEEEKKEVETEEDIIVDLTVEKVREDKEEKVEEDKEARLFGRTDNEELQKPVQEPAKEMLKSITPKEIKTSLFEEETLPLEVEKGPVIGKRVLQRGSKTVPGALSTTCRSTRRGKQSEGKKVAVEKTAEKEKVPVEARTTKRKPGLAAAIARPQRKSTQAHKESEEAEMAQAVPELVVEKVEENEEMAKEKTAAEEKLDEIKAVEDKGTTEEWDKSEEVNSGQEAENKTVKKAIQNLTEVEETEKVDEEKVEAVVGDSYVDEVLEKPFEEPTKELVITLPIEENKALQTEEEEKISLPEVNEQAPVVEIRVLQRGRKSVPVASTSNRMSRRRGKQHEEEKVAEPEEEETAEEEDTPKVETRVLRRGRKSALAAATATPRHKSRQAQKEPLKEVNTAETVPDAVDERFEEKKVVSKEKVEEEREAETDTAQVDGKIVVEKTVEVKAVEQEGTTEDEEKVEEPKKVEAEKDKLVEIAVKKQTEVIEGKKKKKKPVEEPAKKEENGDSVRTHPHKLQKATVVLVDMKEIILHSPVEIENMGQKTDELTKEEVDGKAQENTFEVEEEKATSTTSQVDMEAKSIEEVVEAPAIVKTRGAMSGTKTVSVATPKQDSIQSKHSVDCNEQVVETEKTSNETTVMVEEALTETVESVEDEKVVEANPPEGENVETATTDKQQNVEQEKKEVEAENETVLDAVDKQTQEVVEAGNVEEEKKQATVLEIGANEVLEDSVEKPGLEVEKSSQFEEVEKTSTLEEEGRTSTPEEEEWTSPPEEEERTSPPEEEERTSPLVEERTSPPEEGRTSPLVEEERTSPPEEERTSPLVEERTSTPEEEERTSPPEEERTSPLEEEERTSPAEEEKTSPAEEEERTSPLEEEERTSPPEEEQRTSPPEEEERTSPPEEEEKTSPPEEEEKTSPPEEEKTSPPEEEEKTSPPEEEEKTSPPDEEEKTSPPDEEEKTSPPDEEEKTSPPDEEEKASPSEEVEKTSPPEVKEKAQVVETRALRKGRKSVVLTSNRKYARRGKQPEEEKREEEEPKTQEVDEEKEAQDLETKVLRLGRKSAFGAITATPRQKYTLAHKEPEKETEDKLAEPVPETVWEKLEEEKATDAENAEVELKSTAGKKGEIQTGQQEEKTEEEKKEEEKEEVEAEDERVVKITVGKPTEVVEDTEKVDEDKIETVMGIAIDKLLENPIWEHGEVEDDKSLKTENLKLQKATVVLVDLKKTTLHPPVQIENVDRKTDELTEEDVDNETQVKAVDEEMAITISQEEMGAKCLEEVVDGTPVVEHRETTNRTKTVAAVTPQRKSTQSKPSGDQNKNDAEEDESGNKPTELVKEALAETVYSGEKEKMEGEATAEFRKKVQKERVDEKAYSMDEKKVERETTGKEEKVEDEKKGVEAENKTVVELAFEKQKDEKKPVLDEVFIVSPPVKKMASSEEEKEKISPPEDGEESSETRVLTRGRKTVPAALTQKSSCYPKRKSTRIGKQHEEVEVVELEAEETPALAAATDTPCCIPRKAQKEPEEKVDCPEPVPEVLEEDKGANVEIASVEKENGAETIVIELKAVEEKTTKKERKVENEKKEKAQAKTSTAEEKIIAEEKVEEKANAVEEKTDKAALVEEEKIVEEALAEIVARVDGNKGDVAITKEKEEKEEKTAEILEEMIEEAAVTAESITVEAKVVPAKTIEVVKAITEEEGKMEGEKKEETGIEKDVDKPVGEAVNTSPSKEEMVEEEFPVMETRVLRRGRKSIPSIPTLKCTTKKREKQLEEETEDKPEKASIVEEKEPSIVEGRLLRKGRKSAYAPTPRCQYKRPRKQPDGEEEKVDEGPKLVKEAVEEKFVEDENLKKEKIDEAATNSVEKVVEVAEMKEKKMEESTYDKDKVEEENDAAAATPPVEEELGPQEKAEEVVKAVEEERLEGATPEEEEKVKEASTEVVLVENANKLENDVARVADEAVEKIGEVEKGMPFKEGEDALVETRVLRRGRKSVPVTPTKRKCSRKCQQAEEEAEKLPEVAKRLLDPEEENLKEATEGELVPVLETKVLRRGRKSSNATPKSKRARKETEEEKQVESKNMEDTSQTVPKAMGDKVEEGVAVEEMVGQNKLDVAIVKDQENTKVRSDSGTIEEKKVEAIPKQTEIDMAEQTDENEENTKMITEIAKEKEAGEIQEVEPVDEKKEQEVIEVEEDEMEEEPTDITLLDTVKKVQEKTVEKEEKAITTTASQEEESAKSPNEISEVPPFVETRATRSRTTTFAGATPKRKSMRNKPPVDYNEQVAEEETGSEPAVEVVRNSVVEQEAGIEEEDGEKEKAVESEGADNKEMVKQPEECGTEEEKEEKTENNGMENVENNKNEADNEFDQVGLHLKLAEDEEVEQKKEKMEEEKTATAEVEILKSSEEKEEKKGPVALTRVLRERLSYAKPITTPKRTSTRHSQIVTPTLRGVVLSSDEDHEDSPAEKRNLRKRKSLQPRTIHRSKRSKT